MKTSFIDLPQIRTNILLGAALLIGTAAGGIYYFSRKKRSSQITERKPRKKYIENCNVCFRQLEVKDIKSCAKCCLCGKYICRGDKCSIWLPKPAGWECQLCSISNASHKRTSAWINEQLTVEPNLTNSLSARSEIFIPINQNLSSTNRSDYETTSQTTYNDREKIREHVEDILAKMLGGSLDEISVAQLSKHQQYLTLFEKYHSNLSEDLVLLENTIKKSWDDLPVNENEFKDNDGSYLKLKCLIQTIIQDTLNLPSLLDYSGVKDEGAKKNNADLPYFEAKRYQELLATAVLNKIIDTNNLNRILESKSKLKNLEGIYKEADTSSVLSLESRSDSSLEDNIEYNDHIENGIDEIDKESILSDYLATHTIPLPSLANSDAADFDVADSNGIEGTWEDNWLFKKRKFGTSASSIGMLVPSPKDDVKTLIGDQTADEISDLSEAGSEFEEDDLDSYDHNLFCQNERIKNIQVIGGKNSVGLFDELLEHTSLISKTSSDENQPIIIETLNNCVNATNILPEKENFLNHNDEINFPEEEAVNADVTLNSVDNDLSNVNLNDFDDELLSPPGNFKNCEMNKSEPEEKFFKLQKTLSQEKNNRKDYNENYSILSLENNICNNASVTNNNNIFNHFTNENYDKIASSAFPSEEDADLSLINFIPGSIAERERKKWHNAVEMPNNPYAPEALRRRISVGNEKPLDIPNISFDRSNDKNSQTIEQKSDLADDEPPNFERYSRDYYVHETLQSPKKIINTTTEQLPTEEKYPSPDSEEKKPQNDSKMKITSSDSCFKNEINEDNTYTAKLVHINEESNDSLLYKSIEEYKSLEGYTDSNNNNNNNSLATSEDSDIMRIYDLNTQEEIKLNGKDVKIDNLVESKNLNDLKHKLSDKSSIVLSPSVTKSNKINVIKSIQPKRKIIEPCEILLSKSNSNICSVNSSKKDVIEDDIKRNMPSVKELIKTFLTSPEKRKSLRPKSLPANFANDIILENNIVNNIINLKKVFMEQEFTRSENFLVAERPLSPVLTTGKLKENITFFENLKKR